MQCLRPIVAYRNLGGGRPIFDRGHRDAGDELRLPCMRCAACLLRRAAEWGIRIAEEASLYNGNNMFVTRTFNDECMPESWSLDVRTNQLYIKRLRKLAAPDELRFFTGAEYAPPPRYPKTSLDVALGMLGRPHYHDCILGWRAPDLKYWKKGDGGGRLYRSGMLEQAWPYGHVYIGELTFNSAAYTARYCAKKVHGDMADEHYSFVDPYTDISYQRKPEFCVMSRRPGIGVPWLLKYAEQTLNHDYVVIHGLKGYKKMPVPKAYQRKFLEGWDGEEGELYREMKEQSLAEAMKNPEYFWDRTAERLAVHAAILEARMSFSQLDGRRR